MKLNRREFVKTTLLGATACGAGVLNGCGGGSGIVGGGPPSSDSRVVTYQDPAIAGGSGMPNAAAIGNALDKGMLALAQTSSVESAWRQYFSPNERVGIKPNLLGDPRIAVSKALLDASIDRLQRIGVQADNIIVWAPKEEHFTTNGLPVNPDGPGVKYVSIEGRFGKPVSSGVYRGQLTTIITDDVDAILNLCVIKDHQNAGVTLSMKNHYGSVDTPSLNHDNHCDPYTADLNACPEIKDKARLFIADGSRGCFDGGPYLSASGYFAYNGLLLSNDPVALDYQGWQIIEQKRADAGLPSLKDAGREPHYIYSAQDRGVGTTDAEVVELSEIVETSSPSSHRTAAHRLHRPRHR